MIHGGGLTSGAGDQHDGSLIVVQGDDSEEVEHRDPLASGHGDSFPL